MVHIMRILKKQLEHINIDGSVISSGIDTYGEHDKDILARREMVKNYLMAMLK